MTSYQFFRRFARMELSLARSARRRGLEALSLFHAAQALQHRADARLFR